MPKTQIARTLGMSRNTVNRLAQLEEPPRFKQGATLTAHEKEVLRMFARALVESAYEMIQSDSRGEARTEQNRRQKR